MLHSDCEPLLVLVNVKSGGCQGVELIKSFRRLLNPFQVFDVVKGGPLVGYIFSAVAVHNYCTEMNMSVFICIVKDVFVNFYCFGVFHNCRKFIGFSGYMFFEIFPNIKFLFVVAMEQLAGYCSA